MPGARGDAAARRAVAEVDGRPRVPRGHGSAPRRRALQPDEAALHPDNPVLNSGWDIKAPFFGIVACLVAGVIARVARAGPRSRGSREARCRRLRRASLESAEPSGIDCTGTLAIGYGTSWCLGETGRLAPRRIGNPVRIRDGTRHCEARRTGADAKSGDLPAGARRGLRGSRAGSRGPTGGSRAIPRFRKTRRLHQARVFVFSGPSRTRREGSRLADGATRAPATERRSRSRTRSRKERNVEVHRSRVCARWSRARAALTAGCSGSSTAGEHRQGHRSGPQLPGDVTDDASRTVTVNKRPERIVSLAPANTEIVAALGLEEQAQGRHDLRRLPREREVLPKIGDFMNPNVEAIAAGKPGLHCRHHGRAGRRSREARGTRCARHRDRSRRRSTASRRHREGGQGHRREGRGEDADREDARADRRHRGSARGSSNSQPVTAFSRSARTRSTRWVPGRCSTSW